MEPLVSLSRWTSPRVSAIGELLSGDGDRALFAAQEPKVFEQRALRIAPPISTAAGQASVRAGPNDEAKLPGPPATPSCRAKPRWRPRLASAFGWAAPERGRHPLCRVTRAAKSPQATTLVV